ncbi:hypothetical protein OS493_019784 [Desmophyllum pertusum]|uniref:Uncharacterized protein n=1 Tax=Desmophyllum pertusum TaxID=174260 RepID=A0A9W9Z359_9CNID|nr:hypothetical protein OS493_019784 [Desmophyllum pertusum]
MWVLKLSKGELLLSDSILNIEESIDYHKDICHCGYTPLHLAARYGHENLGIFLIFTRGTCRCPWIVVVRHLSTWLLVIISKLEATSTAKLLNGSSPLHSAAACGAVEVIDYLLYWKANLTAVDIMNGGNWIDVVLKHFNVSVAIKCGKPFNVSVFHLLSYRPPTLTEDNFFEFRKCDKCGECDHSESELRKGPLAEAIESHPLKHSIINSCLDAEGFTPLHRAAQGANLVAIRYLLANGANDSILSLHGYDAFVIGCSSRRE